MTSPIPGLLLILAAAAAIADRRYIRAGGVRSSRRDKIYFSIAVGLCLAVLVLLAVQGASSGDLGTAAGFLTPVLFALWELGRFRTRRANPISPKVPS